MKRSYLVVYEKGKRNYSGFAPDVPGCVTVGGTVDEMRVNLREALELYMETTVEFGYSIPEAATSSITLPLEGELDPDAAYVIEHLSVTLPKSSHSRSTAHPLSETKGKSKKRRVMQAA